MNAPIKDRWLWLALGVALFAVSYAKNELERRIQKTAADEAEMERVTVDHSTAVPRTLPLSTLRTLMQSPNPDISEIARNLILDHIREPTMNAAVTWLVHNDAASENRDLERLASLALPWLEDMRYSRIAYNQSPNSSEANTSEASTSSPHLHWRETFDVDEASWAETNAQFAGWTAIPRERPLPDERAVRRRRREAVVLHEGSGEINEDDIIRPRGRQGSV